MRVELRQWSEQELLNEVFKIRVWLEYHDEGHPLWMQKQLARRYYIGKLTELDETGQRLITA